MRFSAEVRDGKVLWYDPAKAAEFVKTLEGQRALITIEKMPDRHSRNQQAFYRGVILPAMSDATGYEEAECHALLGQMLLIVEKDGRRWVRSTSTLSRADFSDFIERAIRWLAIELHCVVEDPR